MPTAPPRMFPEWGFADTLADYASVNHDSGLIAFAANPYAAMPSLHAMDALIVGIVDGLRLQLAGSREALWLAVAGVGVLRGDGDGEPLLARLRGRGSRSRSSALCCSADAFLGALERAA